MKERLWVIRWVYNIIAGHLPYQYRYPGILDHSELWQEADIPKHLALSSCPGLTSQIKSTFSLYLQIKPSEWTVLRYYLL